MLPPTVASLTIRRAANGWLVTAPQTGDCYPLAGDMHVFNSAQDLGEFIRSWAHRAAENAAAASSRPPSEPRLATPAEQHGWPHDGFTFTPTAEEIAADQYRGPHFLPQTTAAAAHMAKVK